MAELADEQLLLLSNLMHMKEESKFENIWTEDNADTTRQQLQKIFDEVDSIDGRFGRKLQQKREQTEDLLRRYQTI